ncbi:NAD(P)/FAD-dependent oxidoreductase [Streptomyces chattanoogensis]|uniref:NAD(P)/FAD-dependent oxidoreductase n=1 Tax=Streptomyces chattanoogensis TaxID=66876 RepID=UPI0036BE88DC
MATSSNATLKTPSGRLRITVVGGGVIGLLTALECASAGAEVALIEQGHLPHRRGASYDRHRILRTLHPQDVSATRAAVRAAARWTELTRLLGGGLFHRTGALTVIPADRAEDVTALLVDAGGRSRFLGPSELARAYGRLRLPSGASALLEPDSGVLLADRVLEALVATLNRTPGVRLLPQHEATGIDPHSGEVRLASGASLHSDRIVVAAGPWSRGLLPAEAVKGLQLLRQTLLYCQLPAGSARSWAGIPAVPALGTAEGAWLIPPVGDTPLKLTAATACRQAKQISGHTPPSFWRQHLIDLFKELVVDFRADWITGAYDAYYLADADTGGPRLVELDGGLAWAHAACGGGSFKFAPLIARSLAERALGQPVTPTGLAYLDQHSPVRPH